MMFREVKLIDFDNGSNETSNNSVDREGKPIRVIQVPLPIDLKLHQPSSQQDTTGVTKSSAVSIGMHKMVHYANNDHTVTFRVVDGQFIEMQEITMNAPEKSFSLVLKFQSIIIPSLCFNELGTNQGFDLWVLTENKTLHRISFRIPRESYTSSTILESLSREFSSRHTCVLLRRGSNTIFEVLHHVNENRLAIGCRNGNIICVELEDDNHVNEYELSEASITSRLWYVFSKSKKETSILAIESVDTQKGIYIICLCSDAKLRVWSLESKSCVLTLALVDDESDIHYSFDTQPMRLHTRADDTYLIIYYKQNDVGRFERIAVLSEEESGADDPAISLEFQSVKYAPVLEKSRLSDFSIINDDLWALWTSQKPSYSITYGPIFESNATENNHSTAPAWGVVHSLYDDLSCMTQFDLITPAVKEKLLNRIFYDRLIPRFIIQSTLSGLYEHEDITMLSNEEMKEKITSAVQLNAQRLTSQLGDQNTGEESLAQTEKRSWERFCEILISNWNTFYQPVGLISLSKDNKTIGLVNNSGLSLLRPCDSTEMLYVQPSLSHEHRYGFLQYFDKMNIDSLYVQDTLILVDIMHFVASSLGEAGLAAFEESLFTSEEPLSTVILFTNGLTSGILPNEQSVTPTTFMLELRKRFSQVKNPRTVVELLITLLDGNTPFDGIVDSLRKNSSTAASPHSRLVCDICHQILQCRTRLSRDFFLLVSLLSQCQANIGLDWEFRTKVDLLYCKRLSQLLKNYNTASWLSRQDAVVRQGGIYDLSNISLSGRTTSFRKSRNFLEAFFYEFVDANRALLELRVKDELPHSLIYLAWKVIQLLWFLNDDEKVKALDIAHMLWVNRQYEILEGFARMMCPQIPHMNHYIALCLLQRGQIEKTKESFMLASISVGNKQQVIESGRIFESFDPNPFADMEQMERKQVLETRPLFYYFNSIRQVCEQYPSLVIYFANLALNEAENYVRNSSEDYSMQEETAILYSVVFSYSLACERFDDAYVALTLNIDVERKRTDLRRFVSVLCDKGKFKRLVQYPFVEMVPEVEIVLQEKARVSDISQQPNYYQILYSFCIHRGKYDKAAFAMCELGKRLGRESDIGGVQFLKRQAACYVAAINALKSLPLNAQWIMYPDTEFGTNTPPSPLKRARFEDLNAKDFAKLATSFIKNEELSKNTVLTIPMIERAYGLTQARILLVEKTATDGNETERIEACKVCFLEAEEIITLLCRAGIYDMAFTICKLFDLKQKTLKLIFTQLTDRCLNLQHEAYNPASVRALYSLRLEEDISTYSGGSFSTPADQLWNLLRYYVEQYDSVDNNFEISTLVLSHILQQDRKMTPPFWLTQQYLLSKCPVGLLQVYLGFNMLQEAVTVANQYMDCKDNNKTNHIPVVSLTVLDRLAQQLHRERSSLETQYRQRLQQHIASFC